MMKGKCFAELKTSHSQESEIDVFSRLETNFFEKYVKYTITDHFGHYMKNIYEEYFFKKLSLKESKAISICLYEVDNSFLLQEWTDKIQSYFKEKSQSIASGQYPNAFKFLYCNHRPVPNYIKEGELVYVDVRIKLQVARIQEIPKNFLTVFQKFNIADSTQKTADQQFYRTLKNYCHQYFNVFIIYYGDIHFNFSANPNYQIKTIRIGSRNIKLRLFVFYISKVALFETFRSTNKLSVECINDLAISFYEIKREKARSNRLKKTLSKKDAQAIIHKVDDSHNLLNKAAVFTVGSIVVGLVIAKVFLF